MHVGSLEERIMILLVVILNELYVVSCDLKPGVVEILFWIEGYLGDLLHVYSNV